MNDLYVLGAVCSRYKISKRFLRSAQAGTLPSVEKTTRKKFFTDKSLVPYVLCFATIMILFCVCLAHARQQGLGTPVATGVAHTLTNSNETENMPSQKKRIINF